jgi:hypothetical protein
MNCSLCKKKIKKNYFLDEHPLCEDCFKKIQLNVEIEKEIEKEKQLRREVKYWYLYATKDLFAALIDTFASLYLRNVIVGTICFAFSGLNLLGIVINFDKIIHGFKELPKGLYVIGGVPIPFFMLYWALALVYITFLIGLVIVGIQTFFSQDKFSFKK